MAICDGRLRRPLPDNCVAFGCDTTTICNRALREPEAERAFPDRKRERGCSADLARRGPRSINVGKNSDLLPHCADCFQIFHGTKLAQNHFGKSELISCIGVSNGLNNAFLFGAGWSSPVARQAHNLKVTGSNPVPATKSKTPQSSDCGVLVLASSRAGSRCLFRCPIGDPFAVPIDFFADMWRELDQLP